MPRKTTPGERATIDVEARAGERGDLRRRRPVAVNEIQQQISRTKNGRKGETSERRKERREEIER